MLPTPLSSPNHKCTTDAPSISSFTMLPQPASVPVYREKIALIINVIFRKLLKDTEGCDKTLKTFQYIIKVLSYHRKIHAKPWLNIASQFSLTRQILCLGNVYDEIQDLLKARHWRQWWLSLNSVINAIADDVYCLHRLGLLKDKRWGKYADLVSVHCWFTSIVIGLRKNYIAMCQLEASETTTTDDLLMARVNTSKSIADFIFCGCDVVHPVYSQSLQAYSGLISAILAAFKIYKRVSLL